MFDMGKVNLDFFFHDGKGDVISKVTFQSLEDIDLCIEKLQESRAEFEHRIEMKRQKAREKRKRRKDKLSGKSCCNMNEMEQEYKNLMDAYNKLPEFFKELFKPATDAVTELVEVARKENEK